MVTETKNLIRQLVENMEALKSKTSPFLEESSDEERVPYFGGSMNPELEEDEIHNSSSSTPAVSPTVQFGYRAPEPIALVFTDLETKHEKVTLSIISEESAYNQPLREILDFNKDKILEHDLLTIYPVQIDRVLTIEEFETFVSSAKEYFKEGKILTIDVYRNENKEEVEFLTKLFNEWSEDEKVIEKSRLLALIEMNRSKIQEFISTYTSETFDQVLDKIMDSYEFQMTKTDFFGFFEIYPSSATFTPRFEQSEELEDFVINEEDVGVLKNLVQSMKINEKKVPTQEFIEKAWETADAHDFLHKSIRKGQDTTFNEYLQQFKTHKSISWKTFFDFKAKEVSPRQRKTVPSPFNLSTGVKNSIRKEKVKAMVYAQQRKEEEELSKKFKARPLPTPKTDTAKDSQKETKEKKATECNPPSVYYKQKQVYEKQEERFESFVAKPPPKSSTSLLMHTFKDKESQRLESIQKRAQKTLEMATAPVQYAPKHVNKRQEPEVVANTKLELTVPKPFSFSEKKAYCEYEDRYKLKDVNEASQSFNLTQKQKEMWKTVYDGMNAKIKSEKKAFVRELAKEKKVTVDYKSIKPQKKPLKDYKYKEERAEIIGRAQCAPHVWERGSLSKQQLGRVENPDDLLKAYNLQGSWFF